MGKRVAIIAAAGWKGSGCKTKPPPHTSEISLPLAGCPEALLPLGDGETVLSRLAAQLKRLQYEVFIGVGRPGCIFELRVEDRRKHRGAKFLTEEAIDWGCNRSPWSEERIQYCSRYGEVVIIDDPQDSSKHVTFLEVLEAVPRGFSRILLVAGDYFFSHELIGEIDARGFCIFLLMRSEVFILNMAGLEVYRQAVFENENTRKMHYPAWSDTKFKQRFEAVGVPYFRMVDECREHMGEWTDVDFPARESAFSTYNHMLEIARKCGDRENERGFNGQK